MEFRVWTELIQQSRGALHVFLPLLDRGLDAVVHRLTDGAYIPVQVKSRGSTVEGMVEIVIPGHSLVDDRALIIAGLLTDEGLGSMLLVVDEGKYNQLAAHDRFRGEDVYSAAFSMHPNTSHWRAYLVPRERLGERLLGGSPMSAAAPSDELGLEPKDRHEQWLGFLGECEVIRRLAENPRLDLFRPFPDLEMVEVLARDNVSGAFHGLQVKAAVQAKLYGEAHIHITKATMVPAIGSSVVALAWLAEDARFADECLLVPTQDLVLTLRERVALVAIPGAAHLLKHLRGDARIEEALPPRRCAHSFGDNIDAGCLLDVGQRAGLDRLEESLVTLMRRENDHLRR